MTRLAVLQRGLSADFGAAAPEPGRPYPYRADDGREDSTTPGERIVRGGNYIFDDTPDKLVTWNRTVAYRNPATGRSGFAVRRTTERPDTSATTSRSTTQQRQGRTS